MDKKRLMILVLLLVLTFIFSTILADPLSPENNTNNTENQTFFLESNTLLLLSNESIANFTENKSLFQNITPPNDINSSEQNQSSSLHSTNETSSPNNSSAENTTLLGTTSLTTQDLKITATSLTNCTNISTPGDYILTNNIPNAGSAGQCILINNSNITLDCQNYNISGNGGSFVTFKIGSTTPCTTTACTNITVKNCNNAGNAQRVFEFGKIDRSAFINLTDFSSTQNSFDIINIVRNSTFQNLKCKPSLCQISFTGSAGSTMNNFTNITVSTIYTSVTVTYNIFQYLYMNFKGNSNDAVIDLAYNNNKLATNYNQFINFTIIGQPTKRGIKIFGGAGNNFTYGKIFNNSLALDLNFTAQNNTFAHINFTENNHTLRINSSSINNLFYDNFIMDSYNIFYIGASNNFNTTYNCTGPLNIMGGVCMGGNFWADNMSTGYSQTCTDADGDRICDLGFNLTSVVNNTDYLPLASNSLPTIQLNHPANNSYTSNFTILNITALEPDNQTMTIYFIGDAVGINTTSEITNGSLVTYNWTSLSEGLHNWTALSYDGSLNSTSPGTFFFTVDFTAPNTTATAITTTGANYTFNTWTNSSYVNITLNCTDSSGSGCNITIYCADASNTCTPATLYNSTLQISTQNTSYLRYFSNDSLNLLETTQSKTIKIDTNSPNTTATAITTTGANYTFNTWTNSSYINITLNCTDNSGSGCNITIYCADASNTCTPATLYNSTLQISTLSVSYLRYFSNDSLNLLETTQSKTIKIDTTPPIITLNSPINNFNTSSPTLNFNFSETDLSSDANCTLYINGTTIASNASVNNGTNTILTASNISEGSHNWNITCFDQFNQSNTSTIRNFYIDLTPPSITQIIYSPNNHNDIDPETNLTFNATINDSLVSISNVILQIYNGTSWTNTSMSSISANIYQANFTTAASNLNYTFLIRANDSLSNINNSLNQTFTSAWDCSWNISSTNLGATAGWDERKTIGNLTINNTGDPLYGTNNCSLDFRYTHDLTEGRIYYDDSYLKPSNTFTVTAKQIHNTTLNATFLTENKEEIVTITINDLYSRSETSSLNTSATVISTTGGPYLYQTITSSPDTVSLTSSNFSLQGYLRNVVADGTVLNTAHNVSFNWTLPSSFTVGNGNATQFYTNISNNSLFYNNLVITLDSSNLPSLSPGKSLVILYAKGYNTSGHIINHANNRTILTNPINITLECYNISDGITISACGSLDGDYVASSSTSSSSSSTSSGGGGGGGGTGGGGGGTVGLTEQQKEKIIQTEETYELVRGNLKNFDLKVENPFENDLEDVTISLSGFYSQYLSVTPSTKQNIKRGESYTFSVLVKAPKYFTQGDYKIKATIKGNIIQIIQKKKTKTALTESRNIILAIHELSKEDAAKNIDKIKQIIAEMQAKGLNVKPLQEALLQASHDLTNKQYEEILEKHEEILSQKEKAYATLAEISTIEQLINDASARGLKTSETQRLLLLAKAALERGDYLLAAKRAEDTKITFALETAGKINIISFLKRNWKTILPLAIAIGIIAYFTSLIVRWNIIKKRLKTLRKEEAIILGLIQEIQRECFEHNKLSIKEYQEGLGQYERKLGLAIQQIIQLEITKIYIFKPFHKELTRLEVEKTEITSLIKKTQKAYLSSGNMETRVYENRIKSYIERLSEIEERIAELHAKKIKRQRLK
ncbi:hypothetical protein HYX11_00745 [Candidatus Woesearchaeota archaeon]|nr:hypothetical protein [Candidatus Woesearchaeota archaeon]